MLKPHSASIGFVVIMVAAIASGGCAPNGAVEEQRRDEDDVSLRGIPESTPLEPEPAEPGELPPRPPEAPPQLPGPDEWVFGPPDPEAPVPWASGCETPWPMPGCPTSPEQERIPGYEGGLSSFQPQAAFDGT